MFAKITHYVDRRPVLDVRVAPPLYTNVCKLIKADPKAAVENESVGYLKRWIKGLDANGLAKFLRISTGSDVILCEAIETAFSSLTRYLLAKIIYVVFML